MARGDDFCDLLRRPPLQWCGAGRPKARRAWAARKEGADRLEWQTPAWNERAIGFYRSRNAKGVPKMRFGINL